MKRIDEPCEHILNFIQKYEILLPVARIVPFASKGKDEIGKMKDEMGPRFTGFSGWGLVAERRRTRSPAWSKHRPRCEAECWVSVRFRFP
jgi:hypothetical protein